MFAGVLCIHRQHSQRFLVDRIGEVKVPTPEESTHRSQECTHNTPRTREYTNIHTNDALYHITCYTTTYIPSLACRQEKEHTSQQHTDDHVHHTEERREHELQDTAHTNMCAMSIHTCIHKEHNKGTFRDREGEREHQAQKTGQVEEKKSNLQVRYCLHNHKNTRATFPLDGYQKQPPTHQVRTFRMDTRRKGNKLLSSSGSTLLTLYTTSRVSSSPSSAA